MILQNRKYSLRYIKNNVLHNGFIILAISLLAFLLFGGNVIKQSMQKGMGNLERRLGADLMLVPSQAKEAAENMLIEGQRSTFYFDKSIYDNALEIEGVDEVTAQCFLKSLSADCCSSEVEIVFFDPESDFLIGPWVLKQFGRKLGKNVAIVGNDVNLDEKQKIRLFGVEYDVAAKMEKTGSSLDSSVYFSFDSMEEIIAKAKEKGELFKKSQEDKNIISSVFINVKEGYKSQDIIKECHVKSGDIFDVVYPKLLNESLAKNLNEINDVVHGVMRVGGILLLTILFIINNIISHQRKREIALLMILGNSRKRMTYMLILENILVSVLGSSAGCILSAIIVIPFGNYIGAILGMPYLGPNFMEAAIHYFYIIAMVVLIVLISSIFSVFRVSRMDPYMALRREAE